MAYPICPWAAEQLALYVGLLGVIANGLLLNVVTSTASETGEED